MKSVICTVDVVLLTLKNNELHVMLNKRARAPFEGQWSLPGGFIRPEEDFNAKASALRVLQDKTRMNVPWVEQLETFSGGERDPRGWSISVAYYALVPVSLLELSMAEDVALFPVSRIEALPFDHQYILDCAVSRVRNKSTYSSLPVYLCGEHFTIPQLQAVYETLLDEPLNKVTFRKKLDEMDILEPVEGERVISSGANRPAQVYRLKTQFIDNLSLTNRGF